MNASWDESEAESDDSEGSGPCEDSDNYTAFTSICSEDPISPSHEDEEDSLGMSGSAEGLEEGCKSLHDSDFEGEESLETAYRELLLQVEEG